MIRYWNIGMQTKTMWLIVTVLFTNFKWTYYIILEDYEDNFEYEINTSSSLDHSLNDISKTSTLTDNLSSDKNNKGN